MKTWLLFLLASAIVLVHGQLDSCTSSQCLSEPVTYTCTIVAATIRWIVTNTSNSEVGRKEYSAGGIVGETETIATHFTTNLINSTGRVVSTISFTPVPSLNNYNIECLEVTINNNPLSYTCPISIAAIPAAPALPINNLTFTDTELTFLWNTTSNSTCFSHYSVNVTSIDYTINITDTNLTLPIPSLNDTEYSISVVTVDTGGRYMDPQEIRKFITNVPLPVTNVMLRQSDFPGDNVKDNSTVDVIITWNEPPSSPRPPIIQYVISHNITTGPMIQANSSQRDYTLNGATVGSVYTVGIAASNVLGIGTPITATITIYSTSTEVSSTAIPISDYSSSGIMSTTPTSSTVPPAPTEESSNIGGIIGGVVTPVVVVVMMIIIVVVVVFVMKKKNRPVTPNKEIEAVNYAQVEHQSMDSSSRSTSSSKKQKQAPPKPPKGQNESVLYSAVESQPPPQPPQDQMMYADLEHSSRGSTKGAPKDHARVEYSDVRQLH